MSQACFLPPQTPLPPLVLKVWKGVGDLRTRGSLNPWPFGASPEFGRQSRNDSVAGGAGHPLRASRLRGRLRRGAGGGDGDLWTFRGVGAMGLGRAWREKAQLWFGWGWGRSGVLGGFGWVCLRLPGFGGRWGEVWGRSGGLAGGLGVGGCVVALTLFVSTRQIGFSDCFGTGCSIFRKCAWPAPGKMRLPTINKRVLGSVGFESMELQCPRTHVGQQANPSRSEQPHPRTSPGSSGASRSATRRARALPVLVPKSVAKAHCPGSPSGSMLLLFLFFSFF